ncbi:MAG: hypothetical protein AAB681_01255 [Patescibacteria group bacterium]
MDKFSIVNLNNFTWYLNVALIGVVFSVFSLIYNEYYIYYGLITFGFGVLGHIVYKFFSWLLREGMENENYRGYCFLHLSHLILAIAWIKVIICVY